MDNRLTLNLAVTRTPLTDKIVELLARDVRERGGITLIEVTGSADITLALRDDIGAEGFCIEENGAGRRITGNDERGLLYGVGKYLRGCTFGAAGDADKAFQPSAWTGVSVPRRPVRGIYFASHFHNFYHDAPVEQVTRYVEELALWGCNTLAVWFDMHHYNGIADPEAQRMIARLRVILQAANRVGIGAALTTIGNEGYANSPEHLRADWTAGHDGYFAPPLGHYHVELCPSKPGGLELILQYRAEMLAAFADLDIDYVWNWPYDQGGCTCGACAPWGANGFLKIAPQYAELIYRTLPRAKVILSTWYFDHFIKGEWEAFAQAIGPHQPAFADYLLADDYGDHFPDYPLQHGAPGGLPMLNFPEISMYNMYPWGGYGANPLPQHLQRIWDASGQVLSGGFPYSEGIYEDLNKAINLQHMWGDVDAMATVREYAAGVASPQTADDIVRAIVLMEQNHAHSLATLPGRDGLQAKLYPVGGGEPDLSLMTPIAHPDAARQCDDILRSVEPKLTGHARAAWRWRLLRLRAAIDAEAARTGGRMSLALDAMLEELAGIYSARDAEPQVCPHTRQALLHLAVA